MKAQRPKVEPIREPTLFRLEKAFEAAATLKVERPYSLPGILLGTSAFTAAGWEGSFYPRGMQSHDFLSYYATQFATVEADSNRKKRKHKPTKTSSRSEAPMNTEGHETDTQNTKKRFWKDYEPTEKMTFVMTTFAIIYSLITMGLYFIANRQLDGARKDQRPWVLINVITQDVRRIQPSAPDLIVTYAVRNTGKTPAKTFDAHFFVEKVQNGREPQFSEPRPFINEAAGIIFPNDNPITATFSVYKLTSSEIEELTKGRIFFDVYATATYKDIFGTEHWTKYCSWQGFPDFSGTYSAKKCADYNDADNN